MKKESIGNRIKDNYESRYKVKLTRRMPAIIRLDGKAFHTLTKSCNKPFDNIFSACMTYTTLQLCKNIQGAKCAYVQSDEISILLIDYDKLTTDAWFDYNIQKIVSVSAGMASAIFSKAYNKYAVFDGRVFNIPKEEVNNYFVWRQQDWLRNSLQMLCQSLFSHKELHKKNSQAMHDMLHSINVNWNDLDPVWKNGTFYAKDSEGAWYVDNNLIFLKDKEVIEKLLLPIEE